MFGASEADSSARDFSQLPCVVSVSVIVCEQGLYTHKKKKWAISLILKKY